jgi:hypothetical protein
MDRGKKGKYIYTYYFHLKNVKEKEHLETMCVKVKTMSR